MLAQLMSCNLKLESYSFVLVEKIKILKIQWFQSYV